MKSIALTLLLTSLLAFGGCNKDDRSALPGCLRTKYLMGGDDCITKVEEYVFQGRTVYRQVVGECRDFPTTVVDDKCKVVCSCCGFSGIPEGPVEEFAREAVFVRVVWER